MTKIDHKFPKFGNLKYPKKFFIFKHLHSRSGHDFKKIFEAKIDINLEAAPFASKNFPVSRCDTPTPRTKNFLGSKKSDT